MSTHSSIVGGSNAGRLLACPGSYQAILALPPVIEKPSEYAEEGTFAHAVMAQLMLDRYSGKDYGGNITARYIGQRFYDRELTQAHVDELIAPALAALAELEQYYAAEGPLLVKAVELRVKFPGIPGAYGTCDLILGNATWMIHVDWKFGGGVPVKAVYRDPAGDLVNAQLLFYTAAAMASAKHLYKGSKPGIALAIIQPRMAEPLDHVTISRKEVKWFAEDLENAVVKALDRDPVRTKGEHCRWAPCKVNCPLWTGPMLELAKLEDIKRTELVSREITDYAKFLAHAKTLVDIAAIYKKEIDDQLHAYLDDGGTVPGWRLKAKVKQRKWIDEEEVAQALKHIGFHDDEIWRSELVTFAEADAAAKRRGIKVPDHLRVAPPTTETTVCATDDPAPAVNRLLAIEQFQAALTHLSKDNRHD